MWRSKASTEQRLLVVRSKFQKFPIERKWLAWLGWLAAHATPRHAMQLFVEKGHFCGANFA